MPVKPFLNKFNINSTHIKCIIIYYKNKKKSKYFLNKTDTMLQTVKIYIY